MAHTFKIYQNEAGLWQVSYYGDIDPTIKDLSGLTKINWSLDFKTREQAEIYCKKYIQSKIVNEDIILRIPNLTEMQQIQATDGTQIDKVK